MLIINKVFKTKMSEPFFPVDMAAFLCFLFQPTPQKEAKIRCDKTKKKTQVILFAEASWLQYQFLCEETESEYSFMLIMRKV